MNHKSLFLFLMLTALASPSLTAAVLSLDDTARQTKASAPRSLTAEENGWWADYLKSGQQAVAYVSSIASSNPKAALWFLVTGGKDGFRKTPPTKTERDTILGAMNTVAILFTKDGVGLTELENFDNTTIRLEMTNYLGSLPNTDHKPLFESIIAEQQNNREEAETKATAIARYEDKADQHAYSAYEALKNVEYEAYEKAKSLAWKAYQDSYQEKEEYLANISLNFSQQLETLKEMYAVGSADYKEGLDAAKKTYEDNKKKADLIPQKREKEWSDVCLWKGYSKEVEAKEKIWFTAYSEKGKDRDKKIFELLRPFSISPKKLIWSAEKPYEQYSLTSKIQLILSRSTNKRAKSLTSEDRKAKKEIEKIKRRGKLTELLEEMKSEGDIDQDLVERFFSVVRLKV